MGEFHQPAMLILRLVFIVFYTLSLWGFGKTLNKLIFKSNALYPISSICTGILFQVSMIFMLGFGLAYTTTVGWILFFTGTLLALAHKRDLHYHLHGFLSFCKRKKWHCLCFSPLLLIFVRASAPPYFIDSCQYHFTVCDEYIRAGGITALPDNFFVQTFTSFFPEAMFLLPMLLIDSITANLFNVVLVVLCFHQLYRILHNLGAASSFFYACTLLLGTSALFDNAIYGKTDPFVILMLLNLMSIWVIDKEGRHPFWLGLALGVTAFSKYSLSILCLLMLLYFLFTAVQKKKSLMWVITLFIGMCPAGILWLTRNGLATGIPFFPFLVTPELVPQVLEGGLGGFFKPTEFEATDRFLTACKELLFSNVSYRFNPFLFFWLLIATCAFLPSKHRKTFWLVLTLALINWLYFAFFSYKEKHAFRLSFPSWALCCIPVGIAYAQIKRKEIKILLFLLASTGILYLISERAFYLPGVKYHLGKRTLEAYYKLNGPYLGAIANHPRVSSLQPRGYIAVISEHPHLIQHAMTKVIRFSIHFDKKAFENERQLLEKLNTVGIEYLIVDSDLEKLSPLNAKWFKKLIDQKVLIQTLKVADQRLFYNTGFTPLNSKTLSE